MNARHLYEKMVDYKQFAIVMLTVGIFFYLGTILPTESKVTTDIYIAAGASTGFLAGSILFFSIAKRYRNQLNESEEGQEWLMRK
jgi:hypothetical protein